MKQCFLKNRPFALMWYVPYFLFFFSLFHSVSIFKTKTRLVNLLISADPLTFFFWLQVMYINSNFKTSTWNFINMSFHNSAEDVPRYFQTIINNFQLPTAVKIFILLFLSPCPIAWDWRICFFLLKYIFQIMIYKMIYDFMLNFIHVFNDEFCVTRVPNFICCKTKTKID